MKPEQRDLKYWWPAIAGVGGVCIGSAVVLSWMGRVLWCKCGTWVPWSWDIWSLHNSQHLFDPYLFSHVLHGVAFYGLIFIVLRGKYPRLGVVIAALLEAGWEVLENTERVIQHYRDSTISLDYYGDSVANSITDILACTVGYVIAAAVPVWVSALGFALTELILLAWIKDSLLLNVLMLVYPLDAVKNWQMGE